MIHVPDSGLRNKSTAMKMKHSALSVAFPILRCSFHREVLTPSLCVKKKKKKKKQTVEDQFRFMTLLWEYGNYVNVCYSAEEAIKLTTDYLDGKIIRGQ